MKSDDKELNTFVSETSLPKALDCCVVYSLSSFCDLSKKKKKRQKGVQFEALYL